MVWMQDTVRFCGMAGSTTSYRRMLRTETRRGVGQGARLVETALKDKIVVEDEA